MKPDDCESGSRPVRVACALCGCADQLLRYPLGIGALVSCPQCDLTYVSPRLPSHVLAAKLQTWANEDVVDAERLRIAFDPRTLDLYREFLAGAKAAQRSCGTRLLDVGCSTGALLSVARDSGWTVTGIELGKSSAAYAVEKLGLEVHQGSLFDFPGTEASWDVIAFLEVVEHLESPGAALQRIASWLKPGGVLLLSTPNFDSLFRRIFGTRWWVVNCEDEHIVLFNRATLEQALRAAGLELVSCRIRGLDLTGMAMAWRGSPRGAAPPSAANTEHGYHRARSRKESVKALLARLGVLGGARAILGGLEKRFSEPNSVFHAFGEQLVMVARKPLP